ncbi:LOW QUALITY PROTEIN: glyoxylate/hydroxypyruvate reductase B-like [Gigantopelta aegis]|uniref:LOW QUALITY PROTEIN: glyoxylate/hydroxypyruvate reductase B-like n=1 Tax=Gigantopelta aegis TaxID=1735272 RepID=UPI001B88C159|nr:LOW QUALITY PROTEIN: glyoxylate/hydroxypyruvate reductase B-like [Gigantopelta aegis]
MNKLRVAVLVSNDTIVVPGSLAKSILTSLSKKERLSTLTIGIIGSGNIGKEIAKKCKQFGMTVLGLTREPVPLDKRIPYVDQYKLLDELHELLGTSDYVCSVLPSTSDTRGLLSGEVFKHCFTKVQKSVFINVGRGDVTDEASILKAMRLIPSIHPFYLSLIIQKSVFINVGRGDVTDEASILKAMRAGWLSGAILDVFETEPLPTNSELWDLPGLLDNQQLPSL